MNGKYLKYLKKVQNKTKEKGSKITIFQNI